MIQVGDLIEAYHKGFHVVTKVDNDLVYYTRFLYSNGTKSRKRSLRCHISYCRKIDTNVATNMHFNDCQDAAIKLNNILDILDGLKNGTIKADKV